MSALEDPGYQPMGVYSPSTEGNGKSSAIRVTDRFSVKFDAQPEPKTWLVARRSDDDIHEFRGYAVQIIDGALVFHDAPYSYSTVPVYGDILAPGTWRSVYPKEAA